MGLTGGFAAVNARLRYISVRGISPCLGAHMVYIRARYLSVRGLYPCAWASALSNPCAVLVRA